MYLEYLLPMVLQVLAFGVVVLEVLIPSFGLLGVVGLGLFGWSWFIIIRDLPGEAAIAFGIANVVLLPFAIKFAMSLVGKSPLHHGEDLGTGSGLEPETTRLEAHIGQSAIVEAPLRPIGRIRLDNGLIHEAATTGEYLPKGVAVRITATEWGRYVVEKIEDSPVQQGELT